MSLFQRMSETMNGINHLGWEGMSELLDELSGSAPELQHYSRHDFYELAARGTAFITYEFGIDGVSIETFKYAGAMEKVLKEEGLFPSLHFIGGDFHKNADVVIRPHWRRFRIEGMNGWNKWGDGDLYAALYLRKMPEGSAESTATAYEIWEQARSLALKLGEYLENNGIGLLIPVNIPTNPGNFAIMLAIAMVTEAMGCYVLSSNHDFYWEGGMAADRREPGAEPGVRDHFFLNCDNKPFWNLFTRLYPWNGRRWIQVNINHLQVNGLVERFGFKRNRVFELGTSISESFFRSASPRYVNSVRTRMALILSGGQEKLLTSGLSSHRANLETWMEQQYPLVLNPEPGIELDLCGDDCIYLLQPTRVVGRKRIEMDLHLLQALLAYPRFRRVFESEENRRIVLHVSGPTPIEHRGDLENVLDAYEQLCSSVPDSCSRRIFLAFSSGMQSHPVFDEYGYKPLNIEDIYQLATVILFPSETEGRGLPIIESGAGGIPIICSQYYPEAVFEEVVGANLSDEEQIKYILFPENGFSDEFLHTVHDLLLKPDKFHALVEHNRKAVHLRYSTEMLRRRFRHFLDVLRSLDRID